jgi:hypothetical protein
MHERLEKRIEDGLEKIVASCRKRKQLPATVGQRVGRLLGNNSRVAGAFEVKIDLDADGFAKCSWKKWIAGGSGHCTSPRPRRRLCS